MPEAKLYSAEDLRAGLKITYEVEISEEDILAFARLTGDQNPLHVDADYARTSNYQGRITHGAFQVGLASALLGMHLPGKKVLLGTINSRFPAPLYFPCRVKVTGEITTWNARTLGGQLKVLIQEATSLATTAEIFMGFTLHEERKTSISEARPFIEPDVNEVDPATNKLILLTGSSGGLGTPLVVALAKKYEVLALVNRQSLEESVRGLSNVREVRLNMSEPGFEEQLSSVIGGRRLYGLVHAAWPGAPRGSLLQAGDDVINGQIEFATAVTVRLAKILFEHAPADGGRFVAVGSTAGTFKPYLPLGVYSLAKACLEQTVRLLAPELARKKVTINAVSPSFLPVGINKQVSERQKMMESAAIPMGRLCSVEDVVGTIEYLLAPEASFVSGQVLMLTGGQL
ncbi:MAG TPA: SDR family oxidoreductase [Pyrinomonadaceae bacterium]|nr:SDR family oxidoreductase [Pyrinomonadaceae bacterium]